jgi:hypothetical protein
MVRRIAQSWPPQREGVKFAACYILPMSDASASPANTLADRYTIERLLGHGGMATVHLAEERKHKRKVAIKVLKAEFGAVDDRRGWVAYLRVHPIMDPLRGEPRFAALVQKMKFDPPAA